MKTNPMLRAVDRKIAELLARQSALDGELALLRKLKEELAPLVRKRPARKTAPVLDQLHPSATHET